jgi:predicted transcriptional regulator
MELLWQRGSATVQQLLDVLEGEPQLAYNSVLTTVRILEKKGYVKHSKDRRAHIYTPTIDRRSVSRFEVRHLLNRFFNNSHEQLVMNLLEDDTLDAEEIARLKALFEGARS